MSLEQIAVDELMGRLSKNQAIAARALLEPTRDQRLEVHMLAAIAKGYAAGNAYGMVRHLRDPDEKYVPAQAVQHLVDGLADVILRLADALKINPDEAVS